MRTETEVTRMLEELEKESFRCPNDRTIKSWVKALRNYQEGKSFDNDHVQGWLEKSVHSDLNYYEEENEL